MKQFIALLVMLGIVGSCFAVAPAPLPNVQNCDSSAKCKVINIKFKIIKLCCVHIHRSFDCY